MNERPLLVLVDGSSYLFRAFYALPDLRTAKGEPTGAIRGVMSMLRRIVEDMKPDYFAVVFDAPGKTFRDDWYPEYKANRTPMPDDLGAQIEPLREMIRVSGWPLLIVDGVEADDVIGTLAARASARGLETIVSTGDKDMAQLVDGRVTLINTMSNERLDRDAVVGKFGVPPERLLDYMALVGDSIDNVPGVPKVGPKTAARLLTEHGSLDAIIARAGDIPGAIGENLRASLDWLPQARRLLAVKTDCALPFDLDDLVPRPADREQLEALCERFEFRAFLKELGGRIGVQPNEARPMARSRGARGGAAAGAGGGGQPGPGGTGNRRGHAGAAGGAATSGALFGSEGEQLGSAASGAAPGDRQAVTPRDYETVLDPESFERWARAIETAPLVAFDTEANSRDPLEGRLVGLSFSIEPGRACYVPLAHAYPGAPPQLARDEVLARLGAWFGDAGKAKAGQNTKHDRHVLAAHGIEVRGIAHDTMLESYVLESHKRHDIDDLAARHLGVQTIRYEEVCGKGVGEICFDQVPVERATQYSAEDADVTLRLHRALQPRIAAEGGLAFVYEAIEMPLTEVLIGMERHGVLIDAERLREQSRELGARVAELEQQAFALAGTPFNLGSPKQIQEVLFDRMGLPVKKKTATGQPSTDEEVLEALAADYPLPRLLLEHRASSKLKSTYTDKLPQMVDAGGRVHTHYSQATAITGRLASTDPNLQNIPVRTAEGRRIREAFIAPPGHRIVSADYSQVELRIMAHLSADSSLLDAFARGADVHRATAAEIFGVPPEEVSADQRRMIKAVNFGLIYGMSAFGLSQQLGIERSAAQAFIDRYFARYPGVAEYMKRTRELARENGYVETVFGRKLWVQDIRAASGPRRQAAERAAINAPMQGTAADVIKLAMIEVQRWIDREALATRLVMQVHDELVFEVPERELALIERELPGRMQGVARLSVPLVVEVGSGLNWDQAH